VIRESTEGLFASMGKGVVTHEEARETLVITRQDLGAAVSRFSFRLARAPPRRAVASMAAWNLRR